MDNAGKIQEYIYRSNGDVSRTYKKGLAMLQFYGKSPPAPYITFHPKERDIPLFRNIFSFEYRQLKGKLITD
jgi:hypothetical protein